MIRFRLVALVGALLAALALTTASATAAAPPWKSAASSWNNANPSDARVVNLRYATHPGFDRVVIDLQGSFPDGRASYQRRFTQDGSGDPVPILGASGLLVSLSPAVAHNSAGNSIYRGPKIARPNFRTLKALAIVGDFEGQVTFGFALKSRAKYRVFQLQSPRRLVIDFKHPA